MRKEVKDLIDQSTQILGPAKENNPKELEYWKKIFPSKTEEELEVYRTKWGKENPEYLKFKRLEE